MTDPDEWTPPRLEAGEPPDDEEVLIDANELAEGHDFFSLGASAVSPDGRLLAFSTDTTGDERFLLQVKDLATGELLPDQVPGTSYGATWDLTGTHLFYTTVDEAWRPDKIWRHRLGTDPAEDVVVHHETDERFWVSVGRTRSDRFLVIGCGSKVTSEYRILDAERPDRRVPRRRAPPPGRRVRRRARRDRRRGRLPRAAQRRRRELRAGQGTRRTRPATSSGSRSCRTTRPSGSRTSTRSPTHLVVSQRSEGLTQLRVLRLGDGGVADDQLLEMEHPIYTVGLAGNPEFDQPTLRFGYTTMATPSAGPPARPAHRRADPAQGDPGARRLRPRRPTSSTASGRPPTTARRSRSRSWCRKGAPRDGSAPFLLYGYGAYETSMDPYFTISRLSLLDRGMGFAIAHVRGGGELGRRWYDDGKMLHKRNTFTDFVACARHLAATGWTSADRLVAEGGSAGGLLMGAVANLAPEAFAAIVADVPFVDALTSILDPSLPLTVVEWEEWGNPLEDPEVYAYMKSYSPYENVEAKALPADPRRDLPQRHPRPLRRAGQVGRPAAGHRDERRSRCC